MTRGIEIIADLQRLEVEPYLIEGARVAPSVVYLTETGYLGGLTLSSDAECTFAAVALPFRTCPEITLASVAFNGSLVNLSIGPDVTEVFTVMQFHRDRSWVIEMAPYIRSGGSLVWDVEPKVFDDLAPPEPILNIADHLYHHIGNDKIHGPDFQLAGIEDRFRIAGAILLEAGDATELQMEGDGS